MSDPAEKTAAADQAVGYCRPPVHSRFRKGQSGNPRGRRAHDRTMPEAIMRELHGKVLVTENGERRTLARIEVAARQLANKAAGGDLAAMRLIAQLCPNVKEEVAPGQQKHIRLRGGSRSGKTFVLVRASPARICGSGLEGGSSRPPDLPARSSRPAHSCELPRGWSR